MLTFNCPGCRRRLRMPDADTAGRSLRCPACGAEFVEQQGQVPPPRPAREPSEFEGIRTDMPAPVPWATEYDSATAWEAPAPQRGFRVIKPRRPPHWLARKLALVGFVLGAAPCLAGAIIGVAA